MDMRIEVIILPVADVARSKAFYEQVGFVCDTDHEPSEDFRIVQLTPPGSGCSIIVGKGIPQGEPGSVQGTYLVVEDLPAAVAELTGRGIDVSDPFHFGSDGQIAGLDPDRAPYASFATFSDPDGNSWLVQEVPSGGALR
ncbi:MAG: VOC family protein [Actinomycetota bacterium]|nr:VOC family protein [Actinomycetota bacterium]